jgi:hypothetical protein
MRLNWPWLMRSLTHQQRVPKDFESFWRTLELRTPWAALLSVLMEDPVFGWGCPISSRAVIMGQAFLAPAQIPAVSASATEETVFLMVLLQKTSTGPATHFVIGFPTEVVVDSCVASGFWEN